ncbi:MAG: hypothetical protein HY021_08835 [Burkholderiales bacterium]|nr:hypothetical protein [Burkholderiales bacterium]
MAEKPVMNRIDTVLLLLLAGAGWGCAFAAIGLGLFAGVPAYRSVAIVFASFGFAAGAGLAGLRLWLEARLPTDLAVALRAEPVAPDTVVGAGA